MSSTSCLTKLVMSAGNKDGKLCKWEILSTDFCWRPASQDTVRELLSARVWNMATDPWSGGFPVNGSTLQHYNALFTSKHSCSSKQHSKTSDSEPCLQRYNTILPPRGGFCLYAFLLASDNAVSCMLFRQAEAYPRRHTVIFLENS